MRAHTLALLVAACAGSLCAEDDLVVVRAARVITVSGEEFAPGMIVAKNGKVEAVGQRIEVPAGAREVDLGDGVVFPGLVAPRTRLGLGRYTRRGNQAQQRAAIELVARPEAWDELVEAGVIAAAIYPLGSDLPGRAAVLYTHAGELSERMLEEAGYLRVEFDGLPGNKRALRGALKAAEQAIEKEDKARAEWEKKHGKAGEAKGANPGAKPQPQQPQPGPRRRGRRPGPPEPPKAPLMAAEEQAASTAAVDTSKFTPPPLPPAIEPFVQLLREDAAAPRLFVELGGASHLLHFDDVTKDVEWKVRPVFFAPDRSSRSIQTDMHHVIERLGEEQELVLTYPAISVEENTYVRLSVPAELARAGAKVAFLPLEDSGAGYQDLFAAVALLVGEGLPRDVALKGLTLHTAEAAGVGDRLGSLEAGKRADFVVLDGDPLAIGTRVRETWIGAQQVWEREVNR